MLEPFRLIRKSRHLKFLSVILALSVFAAKIIDYQFGYFAARTFEDQDSLAAFYGFWYSNFNLLSLLIQLVLTTRIVGRFGVGYSLLILPAILLINASLLLLIPVLAFALASKMTEASMKQSINKASMELIMLPIPEDIKLRTKTFIDVFIDSLATGISGIILLFIIKAFDWPNYVITAVILIAILAWLYFANRMRKEYKSIFKQSLHIRSAKLDIDHQSLQEDYIQVFSQGDTQQIIKALAFLKKRSISGLENEIARLLNHDNRDIVLQAFDTLMYKRDDFAVMAVKQLKHHDANVRIAAFQYLINHPDSLKPDFLTEMLSRGNRKNQLDAIAAFSKEFNDNERVLQLLRIKDRLRQFIAEVDGSSDPDIISAILKAISYGKHEDFYSIIQDHLNSDDLFLKRQAYLAAGETESPRFLNNCAANWNLKRTVHCSGRFQNLKVTESKAYFQPGSGKTTQQRWDT